MVADLSKVELDEVQLSVEAVRQDKPPMPSSIQYRLELASHAADERLARLVALAERNSTVLGTLRQTLPVKGTWQRLTNLTSS